MKVILLEDIEKLGKRGSIVQVKDGFARNYLLPKKLVQLASPANINALKFLQEKEKKAELKKKEEFANTAQEIAKLSVTIACKAKEDEELFGSVSPQMIADALKDEGHEFSADSIILSEPIKKLGIYQVKVRLFKDLETEFKLWVVKK